MLRQLMLLKLLARVRVRILSSQDEGQHKNKNHPKYVLRCFSILSVYGNVFLAESF